MLAEKNVLITGGGGSVGRALTERVLDRNPNVVRILDQSEAALARLQRTVGNDRCRFLLGDVRDRERLDRAMSNVDIVIHAAAMKHVDVAEYNPFEAVKTNVLGQQNVIDAAIDAGVDRFVFTSSDKAVEPANTMGTTKLLGERLTTAGNKYSGGHDITLASVRFGNVIDSSQSVVPLFRDQIRDGGPVTLTDERMTRFFLTYVDIADLVLGALEHANGGEIFLSKMAAVRIDDLATAMVESLAPAYNYDPDDIDIEVVGRRTGETLHEEIMTARESERAFESDDLYAILPDTENDPYYDYTGDLDGFEPVNGITRSSADADKLSTDEIVTLLERNGALEATYE